MLKRLLLVALAAFALHSLWRGPEAPPIAASELPGFEFDPALLPDLDPIQQAIDELPPLRVEDYRVTPLARFQVAGRVLGAKRYRSGREAELSPIDLALGWGPMADPGILRAIDVTQGSRFYHWHVDTFPIPRRDIEQHSANMHLIPVNDEIARRLAEVREDQQVRFKGYLVNIEAQDGWRWRSSLTRKDRGAGACEVVLVDMLEVL